MNGRWRCLKEAYTRVRVPGNIYKYILLQSSTKKKRVFPLWSPVIKPPAFISTTKTNLHSSDEVGWSSVGYPSLCWRYIASLCVKDREKEGGERERERVRQNNKQLFVVTMSVRQDCARFPPRVTRNVTDWCVHLARHSLVMALSSSSPAIIQISSVNNWRDNARDEVVAGG